MNHTSKMVLVPESAYSSLISSRIEETAPVIFELTRLDEQLEKVLHDPALASDIKFLKYEQLLRRHKQLKQQQYKPPETPTLANPPLQPEEQQQQQLQQQVVQRQLNPNILNSLPATYQQMGQILVEAIEKDDRIQWDEKDQLIFNGLPIAGSNILDLVHDFSKKLPNRPMAKGARQFAQLLKQTNVPLTAIGSKDRRELLKTPLEQAEPTFGVQRTPINTPPYKTPPNLSGFRSVDKSPYANDSNDSFFDDKTSDQRSMPRTIRNSNRKAAKKGQTGKGSDRFNVYHW
jgi:hypothetical protein